MTLPLDPFRVDNVWEFTGASLNSEGLKKAELVPLSYSGLNRAANCAFRSFEPRIASMFQSLEYPHEAEGLLKRSSKRDLLMLES